MVEYPASPEVQKPSLVAIFFAFFCLGLTAFGGPAMVTYIRKMAVEQKCWLQSPVFDNGVALCQAIPGATAMQIAAYTGLRIRGVPGALSAFLGFGLPAFFLMMILSALYGSTSALPPLKALFLALQAIVVALVAYATVSFGRSSFRHWMHILLAGIAAVLFFAGVHPVIVIVFAALLGITFLPVPDQKQDIQETTPLHTEKSFLILFTGATAFFTMLYIFEPDFFTLAATMARVDLFAFGGGFAALPLMFQEVVVAHAWLDSTTFMNGIALGQVTPGPIVITATFVGFLAYGFWGGIVATIAIFIPSFLVVVGIVPYYDRLRSSQLYQKMFQGILFSFVGLLLSVTIRLALAVPWSWFTGILAAGAFLSLLLGAEIFWVVLAGIAAAVILFLIAP